MSGEYSTFAPMKRTAALYTVLFSGLGLFSYFLIVNHTDFSPQAMDLLHTWKAPAFAILAFDLVGYLTFRMSGWVDRLCTASASRKRKAAMFHVAVGLLYLMLNYGLFVVAKALAGVEPYFGFSRGGWYLLIAVWLAEMVVVGLLLSNRALQANRQLQREAARLQMENARARYVALQNQLNPHFLFNCLNTLIAEIQYNPGNATDFTRCLSSVYRYVLQCQERKLVTLEEETDFMDSYLFLHKVRLGDCITCRPAIPQSCMGMRIPPLTLQLLVENIIKHNSISPSSPMTISIGVDDGRLVVSNPVRPKKKAAPAPGIGLRNLSARCRLTAGRDIAVLEEDSIFTVKVPLIQ